MIREVIAYPNPTLRKVSSDVSTFDKNLHVLLDDMYETMICKHGIGLAAVQISVLLNVLIINLLREVDEETSEQVKEDLMEFINPVILESRGVCIHEEGCLSVPGIFEEIERSQWVKIKYFDRFGKEYIIESDGLMAIALQHEIDHLRGHVFIEKLPYLKRLKFEKEWKKTQKLRKKNSTL